MFDESSNFFGKEFKFITFGESHGPYIGVVMDGVLPGLEINAEEIQKELNRRKPGQSSVATPRNESDIVQFVSGVYQGKTTGTPLCMLIKNEDQRSQDYGNISSIMRPGHASFTYLKKYGVFDYRGGGRASGRETALRVAAGAIAKQFLAKRNIQIIGFTRQVGNIKSSCLLSDINVSTIESNIVRSPDLQSANAMIELIHKMKNEGDSIGGVVEVIVKNCPIGLGEPLYHKLDADLAQALLSLGAIKGFEVGNGFDAVLNKGSENNDTYYKSSQGEFRTKTNLAGGILGGISNGEDIILRIAVKPPSSITKPTTTVDATGKEISFHVDGRHDPCICPRVVPVAEAMVALVLMDHILLQDRISKTNTQQDLQDKIETIEAQMELLTMQKNHYQAMMNK